MDLQKRKLVIDIILLLLLFGCLIGLFYSIIQIRKDGGQCIKDPLAYYNNLGKDKCTVTCLGGRILNGNNILTEFVTGQINISVLEDLFR